MKKLLLLTGASLLISNIFAQETHLHAVKAENANASKSIRFANSASRSSNAVTSGFIDYSWQNNNDLSYLFRFNSTFTAADSSLNYVGVALNPFQGVFDYVDHDIDFHFIYPASTYTYTIDSIFVSMSHENNSGQEDLLIAQIVQTTSGPLTAGATVKWADTIRTTTSLSPGGNWVGSGAAYTAEYAPAYTTPAGKKMGIVFKYIAPAADSVGILGSSIDDGTGGTTTQSPFATSYMQNPPQIPTLAPNNAIGYGNPVGSSGWLEAQDWEIWVKVTFNDITGISDDLELNKTATLYQNIPNPANGSTTIKYDLAKSAVVSISFYDVTGKKVKEITEGEKTVGNYQTNVNISDLSKGVYFYKLKTSNGVELTKKMIITE
jgi:hypothetical protein